LTLLQNPFGHLIPPEQPEPSHRSMAEILGVDKEAAHQKDIWNFTPDSFHYFNTKIEGLDHPGAQAENCLKCVLSGAGNVESELMVVKGFKLVVFLMVHFSSRRI
jgi:hypothetical protein